MTELISTLIGRTVAGGAAVATTSSAGKAAQSGVLFDAAPAVAVAGASDSELLTQVGEFASQWADHEPEPHAEARGQSAAASQHLEHPEVSDESRLVAGWQVEPGQPRRSLAAIDPFGALLETVLVEQAGETEPAVDVVQSADPAADGDPAAEMDLLVASLLGLGRDVQAVQLDLPAKLDVNNPSQVAQVVRAIFDAAADAGPQLAALVDAQPARVEFIGQPTDLSTGLSVDPAAVVPADQVASMQLTELPVEAVVPGAIEIKQSAEFAASAQPPVRADVAAQAAAVAQNATPQPPVPPVTNIATPQTAAAFEMPGQVQPVSQPVEQTVAKETTNKFALSTVEPVALRTPDRPTQAVVRSAVDSSDVLPSQSKEPQASPLMQVAIKPGESELSSLSQVRNPRPTEPSARLTTAAGAARPAPVSTAPAAISASGQSEIPAPIATNIRSPRAIASQANEQNVAEQIAPSGDKAPADRDGPRIPDLFDRVSLRTDQTAKRAGIAAADVADLDVSSAPPAEMLTVAPAADAAGIAVAKPVPSVGHAPATSTGQGAAELLNFDHAENAARIARTVAAQLNGRAHGTIRLQLDPPGMGQVQVELAMDREHVRVTLLPASEPAAELLGARLSQLRDSLSSCGLSVGSLSVEQPSRVPPASPPQDGPAAEQQGGQQHGFQQHSRREQQERSDAVWPELAEQPGSGIRERLRIGRPRQSDRPARALDLIG